MVVSMVRKDILEMVLLNKEGVRNFLKKHWLEILLLAIMSILVFINLDWRYIGGDEGYNVTMGQYILKNHGLPKVWDGKNIITTINGNDFNDSLLCINLNYGAYYITAITQLIFGKNTFFIRLPFALMGVISAIIWFKYFKRITNIAVAKIFLSIYCLSIPIIIYIRNANYFAPSLLFIGLMYLSYKKGVIENKKSSWILFVIFSFIQFHVNYMLFIFAIIPILFDYLIAKNYKLSFFISYGAVFITTFPFFLWMRYSFSLLGSEYRNTVAMNFLAGQYRFIEQFWHISFYIAPIVPLLAIFFICKLLNKVKRKNDTLDNLVIKTKSINSSQNIKLVISLIFTILFNFVFLCFFTFEYETRYYLAIFPFLYILMALLIYKIYKMDRIISIIILILLLFTNVINQLPYNITSIIKLDMNNETTRMFISSPISRSVKEDSNQSIASLRYESYFINYVSSYYKPMIDEINVLVTYLNENSNDGDTINSFGTAPWTNSIQYYTNLKLVNNLRPSYGSWANDKNYYNAEKYYNLVYCPDELADWILLPEDIEDIDEELLKIYYDPTKYEKILLRKNLPGMSNDIWLYNFSPSQNDSFVILYRRIE